MKKPLTGSSSFLEESKNNHFEIERDQKVRDEVIRETAAALKTENENLKTRIGDQNKEIEDLQNFKKVKIKVSEKLNKEFSENKI